MSRKTKHFWGIALTSIVLGSCKHLDTIDYSPRISPEVFLASQPWVQLHIFGHSFILGQPLSTFIVCFVGLFTIYVGYRFLVEWQHERSKRLWGIGLCLTGVGALCAGVSFQTLGYEIKCAGREYCTYTSWWEVVYMLLSVPGMNAFLSASAYTNASGNFRKAIIGYACINTMVYSALLLYGALMPQMFFVSFDFFVLMSVPTVLFLIGIHARAYAQSGDVMNLHLRNTWLIFTVVTIAYFTYMQISLTQRLWRHGTWFSENDVLHTGMIIWVYYILSRVRDELRDRI